MFVKLLKVDLQQEANVLPENRINVGFAAKKVLKNLKPTIQGLEIRKFREEAKKVLVSLIQKVLESSPLKFRLTQVISSISSFEILSALDEIIVKRFNKLIEIFNDAKWISSTSADRVFRQFKEFINDKNTRAALENFSSEDHRLDEFYINLLSNYKKPCSMKFKFYFSFKDDSQEIT